ncbi:MAG: 4Fe-4S binding protein [Methanomicrobiaceae archaeon]|uniref:Formylmethanofuran dehydrogenase (Molybdenum) n=1 Tax=hydrocarbon metagenome TaxID=938273 RepID=A0A0W8FJM0_9ZZZZ|nr:4Fe-4S binding protein [Methanomicrobiaceae archaeon]MDD5420260.1 4Fe-4S binding protein [Methanomicrobiaceae archaeon]
MSESIIWYLREFLRTEWIRKFLLAKTDPLVTPPYFKDYPTLTGKECTACYQCMMICPAPGAIAVLRHDDGWRPEIYPGHCIRCGLCVEACPEDVLQSGRVLEAQHRDRTGFRATFHLSIDREICMRCGNCCISCPVGREGEPDGAVLKIEKGGVQILNSDLCTGCKTCEVNCPNRGIRVARVVEGVQEAAA